MSPRKPIRWVSEGITSKGAMFPRFTLAPMSLMNQTSCGFCGVPPLPVPLGQWDPSGKGVRGTCERSPPDVLAGPSFTSDRDECYSSMTSIESKDAGTGTAIGSDML